MQETCRDNGHHVQFAIASILSSFETAWLQGIDLYTQHKERVTAAMELLSLQLNTNNMNGINNGEVTKNRFNTLEIGLPPRTSSG